jgi:hypothetical protein
MFLIGIVGGGVQLGPLGTAATNRPAPGDYDDEETGGMISLVCCVLSVKFSASTVLFKE